MVDFVLDNIQPIVASISALVTGIIVYKKKMSNSKVQTVFLTTQYKRQFKRHQVNFNEQFKGGSNNLFK